MPCSCAPRSAPAPVLPQDRRDDQQRGEQPHDVDDRTALVGPLQQQEADAIEPFDAECGTEGQEQRIARIAPEPEEEQGRRQRRGDDDTEQEAFHQPSPVSHTRPYTSSSMAAAAVTSLGMYRFTEAGNAARS